MENLQPDASELILCTDPRYVCETYIFEPAAAETALGRLFAVGETEDRGGVGGDLLDLTIQALQREYYRDPSRGVLASFESALHQANLVLYDTTEQGVRDWMGYFHVAIGALAQDALHVSTAGHGMVFLTRRSQITLITQDLSHSPITNPLRTFGQVASGTVAARDVLYFGTANLASQFRPEDLSHFALDHSATTISTRLQQLYTDRGAQAPLGILTISILPQHIAQPRKEAPAFISNQRRPTRPLTAALSPRKPLVINRSWFKTILLFLLRMVSETWQRIKQGLWPLLVRGSRVSSQAVAGFSRTTGKGVQSITQQQLNKWRQRPGSATPPRFSATASDSPAHSIAVAKSPLVIPTMSGVKIFLQAIFRKTMGSLQTLPRSSKIFASITLLLAVALITSIALLQQKRLSDDAIQRASELLHDARNSVTTAEDALIYNNRDQARSLLSEAQKKTEEVATAGLYSEEVAQLKSTITQLNDRLQKVVRAQPDTTRVIGDFSSELSGKMPTSLQFISQNFYTFNPDNNTIVKMSESGTVTVATTTNEGIGFFTTVAGIPADKTIIYGTSSPGVALFDAKTDTLQNQEISFTDNKAEIIALAAYGGRLYVYDKAMGNIMSYTKTLRGYSSGTAWITQAQFPKDTIKSIGVDGLIYTLHTDGSIRKLLKGEPVEFTTEPVDPPLTSATKLLKSENLKNIYVVDTTNKRVVIFDAEGGLLRQLFLDSTPNVADVDISPDEKTLYVLDGTRVVAVSLEE
ncbi:MAG: hypothetical protein WEA04_02255 [Candidatus Andersenbacteria bacterium]